MKKKPLKLYVWTNFSPDYTSGLALALASTEKEAKELVRKAYGNEPEWGDLSIHSTKRKVVYCVSGGG